MKLSYLEKPKDKWFKKLPKTKEHPRHWITVVDLEIELSNRYVIKMKKGTIWDGASIPTFLWWLLKPIDEGALGDFIHDQLWEHKEFQLILFDFNIYKTRLFADNERLRWRESHAPSKKMKNKITNFVIRLIGGFYYSRQIKIPN